MQEYLNEAQEMMEMAILHVEDELARIRAGKANTRILDGIRVDSYGTMVPLTGVASITTPDARTIAIKPWYKNMFRVIEKAIIDSPVGITPRTTAKSSVSAYRPSPKSAASSWPSSVRRWPRMPR